MEAILRASPAEILFATDAKGKTAMDWARIASNSKAVEVLSRAIEAYWAEQAYLKASADELARAQALLADNLALVRGMYAAVESEVPAQVSAAQYSVCAYI